MSSAITGIKKNGFWIASSLIAIVMLAGWYLGSSRIEEEKTSKIRDLTKAFSSVSRIRTVSAVSPEDGAEETVVAHPNEVTEEKMKERLSQTVDAVVKAWKMKRDLQEPLLDFPKEVLGDKTYDYFSKFKIPETIPNGFFDGSENEKYLRTYRQQIPRKVAMIAREIKANWAYDQERIDRELKERAQAMENLTTAGGMGMGLGMDMGMGMGMEPGSGMIDNERNKFAVLWNPNNQNLWNQKLTEFRDWDDNSKSTKDPTLLQACMLQQDVWLLEAMFNVIKQINGEASTYDLASIKDIHHIAFGREARAKLGSVMEADKRLGGAEVPLIDQSMGMDGMGMDGMGMDMMMMGGGDMMTGGEGLDTFDMNSDPSPFHGRYVDDNLEPIGAPAVREVVTGETFPETNLGLIVSKRVPFRLAVKMDERKINAFLAACANSPFSFEVLQIRINRLEDSEPIVFKGGAKKKEAVSMEMGGMEGMEGMMMGMEGMMGMDEMGGMGMGFETQELQALTTTPVETRLNYDVDVEFYGVVRIYNEVREDFLRNAAGIPIENNGTENMNDSVAIRD